MKTHFMGKLFVFVTLTVFATTTALAQKLTAEDVIARHLESLGNAEARASIKSRVMQGTVLATVRIGGGGQLKGGAVMASQGPMSLIGLIFGTQDYGNEKMAFDGNKVTLGELRPGTRTRFGGFVLTHDILFKEGLIGGTLSSAWPLLDLANHNPKLRYAGTKKIDGKQTHVIEYEPTVAEISISNFSLTLRPFNTLELNTNRSSRHQRSAVLKLRRANREPG